MTAERRQRLWDIGLVFLLALGLRLGLALALPADDSVFWDQPYWTYAKNFAEGRGFWMPNPYGAEVGLDRAYAFRPPLFPFLWGCVWNATDGAFLPIRATFAVISALACVLAYLAGRELTGRRSAALLGGILCALYPPLVWHGVQLMTEPLFIFLTVACLYLLLLHRRTARWRWLVLAGLAAGLATLTRSVFVGFVPFIAVWLWWIHRCSWRGVWRAAVLGAIVLAVMAPWIIRNAIVLRAFVPTTTDAGHGFYVANNPRALDDRREFWIPEDWSFLLKPGEQSVGEVEAARRLMKITRTYLWAHPGDAARLMARRFITLWRFYPHAEFVGQRQALAYALSYIPIFPFILLGLWLAHRAAGERLGNLILVDAWILYTTAVHVVFLAMMRYREPLMPFLLAFGALGLLVVFQRVFKRRADGSSTGARSPASAPSGPTT